MRVVLTTVPVVGLSPPKTMMLFWRPFGLSAYSGLLPVILGGACGASCALWASMSWRRLVTMLILFYFGLGPVLGFATTQILGILLSLFCGILVSRLITTSSRRRAAGDC